MRVAFVLPMRWALGAALVLGLVVVGATTQPPQVALEPPVDVPTLPPRASPSAPITPDATEQGMKRRVGVPSATPLRSSEAMEAFVEPVDAGEVAEEEYLRKL